MDPRGGEQSRRMGLVPGYGSLGAAGTAFRAAPAAPAASSSHRHTLSPPKAGEISMRTARLFLGRRSELHCVTSWRARREAREGAWSARLVGEKRPFYGAPCGPLRSYPRVGAGHRRAACRDTKQPREAYNLPQTADTRLDCVQIISYNRV